MRDGLHADRPDSGPSSAGIGWCLLAVTAVAAALRSYGLTFQPLWYDELYTRRFAVGELEHLIIEGAARDVHPPGHMLLVRWTVQVFGDSELALRLPSVIAGTLFVPLMYLLGVALGCTRRTSLIAAALGTVSWFPIYYSQEARAYSVLLAVATGLALLAAHAVRAHRRGRSCALPMAGLALLASAACYLHYFGALFALLLAALLWVLALRDKLPKVSLALACLFVAVAYSPWISIVLAQAKRGRDMALPTHTFLYHLGRDLFSGQWLLVVGMLVSALVFRFAPRFRVAGASQAGVPVVLLWTWLLVPVALTYLVSWLVAPVHSVRNLIIVYPGDVPARVEIEAADPVGLSVYAATSAASTWS